MDGWDDPRLVSIAALRRRGFTPESIKMFVDLCGVSKAQSSVDYAMLEYCIREDLKLKRPRMMAVFDPVKLIIDNYPEDQIEYLEADNNLENESLENVRFRSDVNFTLTVKISWRIRRRNISVSSLETKCV